MAQEEEQKEQTEQKNADGKGEAFFERAEQVAETGNWDFAIEMYLQGILRDLENIEQGHQPLREVALKRKALGGKGPGMIEQFKRKGGKTAEEALINAEYLLAKEPGSVAFMVQFLSTTQKLQLDNVGKWICDILLEAQRQAKKQNLKILKLLVETYTRLEIYISALNTCEMAVALAPDDVELQTTLNDLSAKYTIQKGKYDEEGSFVRSVKDMEKQKELFQKDAMVKDESFLIQQAQQAVTEYEQNPTTPGKINAAVDALLKMEEESYENQAIDILTKAHSETKTYRFKMRIGEIKMRQMTRRYRKLVEAKDTAAAKEHTKQQLEFELREYTERAANYPTDLAIKYELGRRQMLSGKLDEAISCFQQAQRDPRRRTSALNYLGQAFAGKGWYREAAETYEKALTADLPEERVKELRYNFGDVLEKMGDLQKAQDQFSTVAQIDFDFKDVRQRLEDVRQKVQDQQNSG